MMNLKILRDSSITGSDIYDGYECIPDDYEKIIKVKAWVPIEKIEELEVELKERIKNAKKYEPCSASLTEICCFKEVLGEEE